VKEEKQVEEAENKKKENLMDEEQVAKAAAGKLILEEEVAIGRITWPTCEEHSRSFRILLTNCSLQINCTSMRWAEISSSR
jgi:hypothetical protein